MLRRYKVIVAIIVTIMITLIGTVNNTTTAHAKTKYNYAKTLVNVRSKPTKKSKSLGQLYELQRVIAIDTIGKWTMIEYKNKIAYVKSKYLTSKKRKSATKSTPSGAFKSYEDYRCITAKGSLEYKIQHNKAYTDSRTGIRMVNGRYCIALGSYYVKKAGIKVDLIMKNDTTIPCYIADEKSDRDTVNNHRQHPDGSVVEFVVDTHALPRMVRRMGDISYVKPFKGSIKAIKIYK